MWLVVLAYGAVIATLLWYSRAEKDEYCFKYLALMLWGATIMVFIDHVFGYINEGSFMEVSTDAIALGFSALLGVLVLWLLIIFVKDPRRVLRKA